MDRVGKGGFRGRGLPEGPDHAGGLLDGFQSLAADVADDEPGEALGDAAVVEVPADDRVRCGGQVPGRRADGPGARRHGRQDDPLGGLRDGGDPRQMTLAVDPDDGEQYSGRR